MVVPAVNEPLAAAAVPAWGLGVTGLVGRVGAVEGSEPPRVAENEEEYLEKR